MPPMLIVANIRKILYPRSVTMSGVTFERTKSARDQAVGQGQFIPLNNDRDALNSHCDALAVARP